MAARDPLSDSHTFPSSDSENYDANHSNSQDSSDDRPSSSSSPLILYSPPTFWSIIRGAAINLFLPFVNGLMLGFGELVAHEAAWRLGWGGTKVSCAHCDEAGVIDRGVMAQWIGPAESRWLTSYGTGISIAPKLKTSRPWCRDP